MKIRGNVDGVLKNKIIGWAAAVDDDSDECRLVAVEAILEGKPVARARADRFRDDLKRDGLGTGAHGFEIELPDPLRHGGPFLVSVRAAWRGPPVAVGHVVVVRGEAADFATPFEISAPRDDADLDQVLAYIRSISHHVLLAQAEEVGAELGNPAVIAFLFGRLLERMPDRRAYENYVMALTVGLLDVKGLLTEILQSEEYKAR